MLCKLSMTVYNARWWGWNTIIVCKSLALTSLLCLVCWCGSKPQPRQIFSIFIVDILQINLTPNSLVYKTLNFLWIVSGILVFINGNRIRIVSCFAMSMEFKETNGKTLNIQFYELNGKDALHIQWYRTFQLSYKNSFAAAQTACLTRKYRLRNKEKNSV